MIFQHKKLFRNGYIQQVQSRALLPCRLRSYREIENYVSLFTFFFFFQLDEQFSSGRGAQIHSNIDEKIHCLYKRNPFLKTTAKEKPPAGLVVWPAKRANMEMITKWQHPPGPSIPDQILQSRWWATWVPWGKSSSLQAIWHIIHRTVGRQLWL